MGVRIDSGWNWTPSTLSSRWCTAMTTKTAAVVADRRGLAVDERLRRPDLPAEGLDDRLMAEADAERRNACGEPADDLGGRSRVRGPSRPRRDHELGRAEPLRLVGVELVVSAHADIGAELGEEMREVVR